MKKSLFFILLVIFSCKENVKKEHSKTENQSQLAISNYSEAEVWLKNTIERFFNKENGNNTYMKMICTKDYYEYKMDEMNVDLNIDGSLSKKEFLDKWKSKFDVNKPNFNSGFLVSGQDWDHIVVTKSNLIKQEGNSLWFDVVLEDAKFNSKYHRIVKVLSENNQFLIADVEELD